MRKTEEKEFKLDDETIKVLHTRLQPRAALKLGMRLLRLVAPLMTGVDIEKEKLTKESLIKMLPLAMSTLDDDTLDELLGKVFATTIVIRDADAKQPQKCECTTPAQIDKAFDGALGKMLEAANWIIEVNLENFSFGTDQKEKSAAS